MADSDPPQTNISVPVRIDAFIFNPQVCDSEYSKICPLTQPNYLFLRFKGGLIENDILSHHDLHAASPPSLNSRLTDIGTAIAHRKRMGVYLHWVLPRVYRAGTAAVGSSAAGQGDRKKQQGFDPDTSETQPDYSSPDFRSAPNRWMVVRRLENSAGTPLPEFQAWVLESDRLRNINDLDVTTDVEVDVSPFINPELDSQQVEMQSEVFLGYKENALTWAESTGDPTKTPRAKLSLLTSSNNLFADYQPHNAGVFSILDNFEYPDPNNKGQFLYLDNAKASYYLVGWHSDNNTSALDPFNLQDPQNPTTYGARLKSCLMQLAGANPPVSKSTEEVWSDSSMNTAAPVYVVCHGAMYDVNWDVKGAPAHIPADDIGKVVKDNVGVGTTTLDALLAYVRSQVDPDPPTADDPQVPTIAEIETDLLKIQSLLLKQEDGVDPQLEAEDLLYEGNFAKSDGGVHWHLSGKTPPPSPSLRAADMPPAQTPPDTNTLLDNLNACQTVLDICQRNSIAIQWQIFAEWWKYVADPDSDPADTHSPENPKIVGNKVKYFMDRLVALLGTGSAGTSYLSQLTQERDAIKTSMTVTAEQGAAGKFYTQKDPTVLVAGVQTTWPANFASDNTTVRMDGHIITALDGGPATWPNLQSFRNQLKPKFPGPIQNTADILIAEWGLLQYPSTAPSAPPQPTNADEFFPTFHDVSGAGVTTGLDSLADTQGWFPLFIEWEATYYHLPFSVWTVEERKSDTGQIMPQYRINDKIWLQDPKESYADNQRTISGRTLLLPQPTYSLGQNVKQILKNTPPDTLQHDYNLPPDKQKELGDNIDRLPFLSATMSGFTDNLLTMIQGTHIKPTKRAPGGQPQPMQEAIDASSATSMTSTHLSAMAAQTNKTPYGSLVPVNNRNSPFKPVTHGQWQFTKLNIIDKFGQALTIVDQTPRKFTDPPATVYPCISNYYAVDKVLVTPATGQPPVEEPNTVLAEPDPTKCRFVQIPPTINQDVRLNCNFVVPDSINKGHWRSVDASHENPVWGWLVVNYADYGIQLFLENGTFYREVRVAPPADGSGGGDSSVSPPWAPFQPPAQYDPNQVSQLDKLVQNLLLAGADGQYGYLFAVAAMINSSILNMPHLPNAFAGFLTGLVGKPLALVNMGVSMELASMPLITQSNVVAVKGDEPAIDSYKFPVKIGDGKRAFDGMVGYFPAMINGDGDVDLDLTKLYTYFPTVPSPVIPISELSDDPPPPKPLDNDPTLPIDPSTYPTLTPFYPWPAPLPSTPWDPLSGTTPPDPLPFSSVDTMTVNNDSKLSVYGTIIDPFSPIHFYTASILPVATLSLPDWTIGDAMKKMTAFIRAGPVLATVDVPISVDPKNILSERYSLAGNGADTAAPPAPADQTPPPSVQVGGLGGKGREQWRWLQPYYDVPPAAAAAAAAAASSKPPAQRGYGDGQLVRGEDVSSPPLAKTTLYNALPLTLADTRPRFENGPYTALEGYLQLAVPIVKPAF